MPNVSVYIHFPYCLYKCHYCDFNSYAVKEDAPLFDRYLDGLERELLQRLKISEAFSEGSSLYSLFIGGGTPSLLAPVQLERLILLVTRVYPPLATCEITVECNPKTLTREKIDGFRAVGINRLSIGIQSFKDKYLSPLGRIHSGQEAIDTLSEVAKSGFQNVNTDLIFGFPGQTLGESLEDLKQATDFGFPHLSLYSLTAEPGTPFYRDVKQGRTALLSNDAQYDMMRASWEMLSRQGFAQYEVSNFYRGDRTQSRHNLCYWDYAPFLGLGAGATSFFHETSPNKNNWGRRQVNVRAPEAYLKGIEQGAFYDQEIIDEATAVKEWLMMGLRKMHGVTVQGFERLFPAQSWDVCLGRDVARACDRGLLVFDGETLVATKTGFEILDSVVSEFF